MNTRSTPYTFSLLELLTIITIIAVLLALLIPAISASREATRRTECTNNLKNIALGLQYYNDTYRVFPAGVLHTGISSGGDPLVDAALGPSWWFGLMPFMESRPWYDRMSATQRRGSPPDVEFCADDMVRAGLPIHTWRTGYWRCPSSPLPEMEKSGGPIALPSYVGISGGCDIDANSHEYQHDLPKMPEFWPAPTGTAYYNASKGIGAADGGIVTASGMLPPCEHVNLDTCTDGISYTMIVAEQSDWLREPGSSAKFHGDAGWTVGGTGPGGGFLSGTRRVDPVPPPQTPGGPPSPWGADCWNITTVRYPPDFKLVMGNPPLPGCSENHAINNPLQSAHPGGLLVAMVDGSVEFVARQTELAILLRMAIRDDGIAALPGSDNR